jgi:hypothetical protein
MFIFGVLVGRGIPLVDVKSQSLQAQLLRFLGLGRETVQPVEHAADTWDPHAVSKSLEYYENLTQKNAPGQSKGASASPVSQKNGAKDASAQKPKAVPPPPQPDAEKSAQVATKEAYYEADLMSQELLEYSAYTTNNSYAVRNCPVRKGEPLQNEIAAFLELVREITEWRLEEYLAR